MRWNKRVRGECLYWILQLEHDFFFFSVNKRRAKEAMENRDKHLETDWSNACFRHRLSSFLDTPRFLVNVANTFGNCIRARPRRHERKQVENVAGESHAKVIFQVY